MIVEAERLRIQAIVAEQDRIRTAEEDESTRLKKIEANLKVLGRFSLGEMHLSKQGFPCSVCVAPAIAKQGGFSMTKTPSGAFNKGEQEEDTSRLCFIAQENSRIEVFSRHGQSLGCISSKGQVLKEASIPAAMVCTVVIVVVVVHR